MIRRATRLAAPMLGLVLALAAPSAALADTSCSTGNVCLWSSSDFQGSKQVYDCNTYYGTGQHSTTQAVYSAKNRCNTRSLRLANSIFINACINPGGQRASFEFSDRFEVGGGAC